MENFRTIAKLVKTRGIQGELAADILTEFPERYAKLSRVHLFKPTSSRWELVERCWLHKKRVIFKFSGYDRPDEAHELVGYEVQVPESEQVSLPRDTYFDSDLVGCEVIEEGHTLGKVTDLLKTGASANLIVITPRNTEFMVPLVSEFIVCINVEKQQIEVRLPEGLVDLEVQRTGR